MKMRKRVGKLVDELRSLCDLETREGRRMWRGGDKGEAMYHYGYADALERSAILLEDVVKRDLER